MKIMKMSDLDLVLQYARQRSEEAFATLVKRHLDLVYSVALRQVKSPQLAEEVAQSVFTDLARNADKLKHGTILTAWLYQVARRTAIDVVRSESRRQFREQIALEMNDMNSAASDWMQIEPLLDEGVEALDATDRVAILLRYFENKGLREVGETLGISEDAAQKRVSRAVERLRELFTERGVTVGPSGLAVAISANAVQVAPSGLSAAISTAAAFAGTALQNSTAITTAKAITMTTLQKIVLTTIVVASLATPIFVQHQSLARLRGENSALRKQAQELDQLREDNQRLAKRTVDADELERLRRDHMELMRLRGQAGELRSIQQELTKLKGAYQKLYTDSLRTSGSAANIPPEDIIPKESWAFMGYQTAGSALQSVMWAMKSGDVHAFRASLTPEAQESMTNQFEGKSDSEIAALLQNEISGLGVLRLDRVKNVSDTEATFVLYSSETDDGKTKARGEAVAQFKHIGGEWKFTGF